MLLGNIVKHSQVFKNTPYEVYYVTSQLLLRFLQLNNSCIK